MTKTLDVSEGGGGQFIVELPPELIAGRWVVIGRCRAELQRGERLLFSTPLQVEKHNDDYEAVFLRPLSIDLIVENINAYGRDWEILDRGMTARIELSGDGCSLAEKFSVGHYAVLSVRKLPESKV